MDAPGAALVITSLSTLIVSIGGVIVSLRNSKKIDDNSARLDVSALREAEKAKEKV
jgi:hypothetical protein